MNIVDKKSLVNSDRKRTQRSYALEPDTIDDIARLTACNRATRRLNARLATERFERLGSLRSMVHASHGFNRVVAKSIRRQFDCLPVEPRRIDGLTKTDRHGLNFQQKIEGDTLRGCYPVDKDTLNRVASTRHA